MGMGYPRPLELDDLRRIVAEVDRRYGVSSIVTSGGEPTADRSLPQILTSLAGRELKVLTNGYLLKRLLPAFVETGAKAVVSVKSVDPQKHEAYTGRSLTPVLEGLRAAFEAEALDAVETVLIPGFNDAPDVEALAEYISRLDDDIELIIDAYIPVPGAPWRKPYDEELLKAREAAERHLRRVRVREPGVEMRGRAIIIYPP